MQSIRLTTLWIAIGFMIPCLGARSIAIKGTLQDATGKPIQGIITLFHALPNAIDESFDVAEDGIIDIATTAEGELIVHAWSLGHPSEERVVPAAVEGQLNMSFALPIGQTVQGRVVDPRGNGVADARVRVRYNEPGKPTRKITFDKDNITDGNGQFLFHGVGIQTPFYIDVLAQNYMPMHSKLFKLSAGVTELENIMLDEPGGTIVVSVMDKTGAPASNIAVTLYADPTGYPATARGSWLLHRGFRQQEVTSAMGNVRFSGVPLGRVLVRIVTSTDKIESRAVATSGTEVQLRMSLP